MNIAPGVEMLEITTNMLGRTSTVHPMLLTDKDNVVLIDTGYPNTFEQVKDAINQSGVPFDRLDTVIITHHDIDHIGGLAAIVNALGDKVKVLAHADEKAYVQGEKRPLKLAAMEDNLASLPENTRSMYPLMKAGFEKSFARVDRTLVDGERLPFCGGITVIFTPGHTLGHISLYLEQSKTLVTGDALRVENGQLERSSPSINYDMGLYNGSLKKFAQFDVEKVICYHGGLYTDNSNKRLSEIINI